MSQPFGRWQRDIHWRRLDHPARETAVLEQTADGWVFRGVVAGADPERHAYELQYTVECAPDWVTRAADVEGHVSGAAVRITLARDSRTGAWTRDGSLQPQLDGCLDVDLGFSPSTNTLPIRRLGLRPGGRAQVRAAWLRFPGFELVSSEQEYRCEDERRYVYESAGGQFRAVLEVDDAGLVRRYGDYWLAQTAQNGWKIGVPSEPGGTNEP
jgi:uncharacterized protein